MPAPRVTVACRLQVDARKITGRVAIDLVNPAPVALDRFYLWLYPNRFASVPPGVDDVTIWWLYPDRFDPGHMWIDSVEVDQGGARRALAPAAWHGEPQAAAGRGVLWSIALPEPIPPGASARVAVTYGARVPERLGAFGCVHGQCTFAGGFYPMPAALDAAGWDLTAPPMRADLDVAVSVDRRSSIVLFDQWSGDGAAALHVRAAGVRYATLVVAPALHASVRRVGGVLVRYLSPRAPPPAPDAQRVLLPYTLEDYAGFALDTAETALALLPDIDPSLRPRGLTMVEAPLRFELASFHERVVLVSDRFYRIWPAERFRKFHRRQLARAIYAHWALRAGALRDREPSSRNDTSSAARRGALSDASPIDPDQAAELVAAWLTDLFVLRRYERHESLSTILRPVSFVPAIDQLLYAPQTMFADAYFGELGADAGVLDPRDDPRLFAGTSARGRLLYEKLRDLVGAGRIAAALRRVLARGEPLAPALESAAHRPLAWFFRQWSFPAARINLRLAGHFARPAGDGRYDNSVVVERETAPGDEPPSEPVDVVAVDRDGTRHRLRWAGDRPRGTVSYRSASPVEWAWVDPDGRTAQTSIEEPDQHPRFDDRDRHPLRFVYNSFGVLLNVSDLSALLAIDFTLSRIHDLRNQMRFLAYRSSAVVAGGLVSLRRGFGREVIPDRLLGRASLALGAARLDPGFFGADAAGISRGAFQTSLTASLGRDTEVYLLEPLGKHDLLSSASVTVTRRDDLPSAGADYLVSGALSVSTSRTITPIPGNTVAGELAGAVVFGDLRSRTQLLAAGGATGLRGFSPGALFGRALITARGEYRHAFVHDLDWNFGHYSYVRGLGGVAFLDVGLLSPCDSYVPGPRDQVAYGSIGYGVQAFYDNFGTLPSLMRIDGALRLSGRPGQCLGQSLPEGPMLQVYVTFLPPF